MSDNKKLPKLTQAMSITIAIWLAGPETRAMLDKDGPSMKALADMASEKFQVNVNSDAIKRIAESAGVSWETKRSTKATMEEQMAAFQKENDDLKAEVKAMQAHIEQLQNYAPPFQPPNPGLLPPFLAQVAGAFPVKGQESPVILPPPLG